MPKAYEIEFDHKEKSVKIHLNARALRRFYGASMLWSYDGKKWIKNTSGKAVETYELDFLTDEELKAIHSFFASNPTPP